MEREKIIIKTSFKGIAVNIILVIFKAIVGFVVNSIAIILDAVNNLSDAISSIITIVGTKLAGKAPDKDHPYGHGRIEYFASIIIAVIILFAGLAALKESIEKIIHPAKADYSIASIVIIIVAIFVKFFFGKYVKKTGEKINSQSLVASGTDALFDSIVSLGTLIAAIVSIFFHISIEGIIGALISVVIIKSSIEMLKETINSVIGYRIDKDLAIKIKERVNKFEEVEGVYDLILHDYGPTKMMGSLHIQIPDELTARQIDSLTRKIRAVIYSEFGIIVTIGIYATNISDEESSNIKNSLVEIIKEYPEILQLHGFYLDKESKFISFDLIIGYDAENPNKIRDEVVKKIKEKYVDYNYYAIIDNDFSD